MNTSQKIILATAAYRIISFGRRLLGQSDSVTVRRGGIVWGLNLREGIDFSIYLLGGFELGTLRLYRSLVGKTSGEVILDIGANIGAHTLPLADLIWKKSGIVYAFEPTAFAFRKLMRNISLNPYLKNNIIPVNAMLVANDQDQLKCEIYSSWPLQNDPGLHDQHRGKLMSTDGAEVTTLDSFVEQHGIKRVDFIKLDVDGNEPAVLAGARKTIKRFGPSVLMEWSPHIFADQPQAMSSILSYFLEHGYTPFNGASGHPLPENIGSLNALTPTYGSMNILFKKVKKE